MTNFIAEEKPVGQIELVKRFLAFRKTVIVEILGANEIKNYLTDLCPYLQRYKIKGRNARILIKKNGIRNIFCIFAGQENLNG